MPNENGLFSDEEVTTLVSNVLSLEQEFLSKWSEFKKYPEENKLYDLLMVNPSNFERIYRELESRVGSIEFVIGAFNQYEGDNYVKSFHEKQLPNRIHVFFMHVFLGYTLYSAKETSCFVDVPTKETLEIVCNIMSRLKSQNASSTMARRNREYLKFLYKDLSIALTIVKIALNSYNSEYFSVFLLQNNNPLNDSSPSFNRLSKKHLNIFLFLVDVLKEKRVLKIDFYKQNSSQMGSTVEPSKFIFELDWLAAFEQHKRDLDNPMDVETTLVEILGRDRFSKKPQDVINRFILTSEEMSMSPDDLMDHLLQLPSTGKYNAAQMITQHSSVINQQEETSSSHNTNKKNDNHSGSKCVIM